jgi:hypothetical protein
MLVLYTGVRPQFEPISLAAGLLILACAFIRRPIPGNLLIRHSRNFSESGWRLPHRSHHLR